MSKIVLIGSGKWGQRYISTLNNFSNIKLTIANRQNWKLLVDEKPDGVIVCTPPHSHINIASYSMEKGIPTMVEKPLALSFSEAKLLKSYNAPILVNHIHLFSQRFRLIKGEVNIKSIVSINSIGVGNNPPRDYSDLWDYGPHDISMILDLMQSLPSEVICQKLGRSFTINMKFGEIETTSLIGFDDKKTRYLRVDTVERKFEYNGLKGNDLPLTNALQVFVNTIHGKSDYRLGLDLSIKVMQVLEMCQKSLELSI